MREKMLTGDVKAKVLAITSTYEHVLPLPSIHLDWTNLLLNLLLILRFPIALTPAQAHTYNLAPTSLA